MMNTPTQDVIVAYCGLVCSQCGAYTKGKCEGCFSEKPMFKKCPVKKCNIEREYSTCADCSDFEELKKCKKLNTLISKIIGFLFRRNRIENLYRIRKVGLETYKAENL